MGMRMNNINMKTRVSKDTLLEKLRANLTEHSEIAKEAREGYLKKAQEVLLERVEELKNGKVANLNFNLAMPTDYSDVYKATIQMLEMNLDNEVILEADEFKQLVMDEWEWSDVFSLSNSFYSGKAAAMRAQRR